METRPRNRASGRSARGRNRRRTAASAVACPETGRCSLRCSARACDDPTCARVRRQGRRSRRGEPDGGERQRPFEAAEEEEKLVPVHGAPSLHGIAEVARVDLRKHLHQHRRNDEIHQGDDPIDLEAAERVALDSLPDRGQFIGRYRRRDARRQRQQDELAGERGKNRPQRRLQHDQTEYQRPAQAKRVARFDLSLADRLHALRG